MTRITLALAVAGLLACDKPAAAPAPVQDLLRTRAGFKTELVPSQQAGDGPADPPPKGVFNLVHYQAPSGELVAYITPDPKDGKKHPALLWLKGGWGGIGEFLWEKGPESQAPNAFREAGFVVMCPSYRGENDNPGKIEAFFGEVDDALAALQALASLPSVDPARVYVAGHSTGGTLALLVAEASEKPRAVFAFGGRLDMEVYVADRAGSNFWPFNERKPEEVRLRNPLVFAGALKTALWYFEGEEGVALPSEIETMQARVAPSKRPFHGYLMKHVDHFTGLQPALGWLAAALQKDQGPAFDLAFDTDGLQKAVDSRR